MVGNTRQPSFDFSQYDRIAFQMRQYVTLTDITSAAKCLCRFLDQTNK